MNDDDDESTTSEKYKAVANQCCDNLVWEDDVPSAHPGGKLPILDMQCWLREDGVLLYEHFEKPVSSKQVISVRSAHSSQGKRAVHINEIVRRLLNCSPLLSWAEAVVPILEEYMRRMSKAGYSEAYRHDVLTSAINIYEKKVKEDADGTCPLNRPPGYKMAERRRQKREKKRNWTGKKGRGGIPIIIPATEGSSLAKEMRRVAENVSRENPEIVFSIIERGGISVERMLMKTNPTESEVCGRKCFCCNQDGEHKNMCRKSNVLYNWECNSECDAGYDGQSSKNNFTRSSQHTALYESWTRHEAGVINPKSKKPYSKPQSHSFIYDHQLEDHDGAPLHLRAKDTMAVIVSPAKWQKVFP